MHTKFGHHDHLYFVV